MSLPFPLSLSDIFSAALNGELSEVKEFLDAGYYVNAQDKVSAPPPPIPLSYSYSLSPSERSDTSAHRFLSRIPGGGPASA
jgi:hypothetical protein